jgi:ElaA protein
MIVHSARFDELDAHTLYALLKLRTDIFVVEQKCPYPDLDGRDHEPTARHLWVAPADQPAHPRAYLRVLIEPGGSQRIGRVCTAVTVRGTGLSGLLVAAALTGGGSFVLAAQSHLVGFYQRFGFEASGPEFIDDGIPHTPMRRG